MIYRRRKRNYFEPENIDLALSLIYQSSYGNSSYHNLMGIKKFFILIYIVNFKTMMSSLSSSLRNNFFYIRYKKNKAKIALSIYDNPAKNMFVIGITGTNGKTTTSFLIHHIFNSLVDKTFLLGTNEIKY